MVTGGGGEGAMRLALLQRVIVAMSLPGSLSCTPLGLWLYEDPEVTVSRVRLGSDSLSAAPVLVALDLQNRNDYPISTVHLQLSLALDDLPVGELSQDSTVVVPKTATSTVALPLVLGAGVPATRLTRIRNGTHKFTVMGRAEFTTPVGTRRVRFAQEGDLRFGPPPTSVPTDPNG
jgi:LEA14-like dessication related protein